MTQRLQIGISVDIQRTNGRIHSAVVSSVDLVNKSVTVEWSEAEEIKGKEIDFESLFMLNPNLDPSNGQNNHTSTASSNSRKTGIAPPSSHYHGGGGGVHSGASSRPSIAPTSNNTSAIPSAKNTGPAGSLRSRPNQAPNNRRETLANGNGYNSGNTGHHHPLAASALSVDGSNNAPSTGSSLANQYAAGSLKSGLNHLPGNEVLSSKESAAAAAAARRRSNVVKEVDRIKKQREERRERQAKERQEKSELMSNVEPGNPNWEFLGMIRDYRASLDIRPISMSDPVEMHQICVAVRKRPMNKREIQRKDIDVVTVPQKNLLVVHEPKHKVDLTRYLENHMFRFDYAFDENAENEIVYKYTAKPLVQTIFEGGMATCFAYGQTGSGKTHTMGGDFGKGGQDSAKGIYGLAARDVFKLLRLPKYKNEDLYVAASFFEIYSGKVFDLLNGKAKLRVLEDARNQVQVVGLQERIVESVEDVLKLIQTGNNIRTSGQTSANNHSSRSHAVFQLQLKKRSNNRMRGKFSLIDLAGNERGADTSSSNRTTRMEGAEINKSLLALKECIRALGRKGAHLPFRASKLTQVLRDSFIGENSRTCMIAMISPGMQSCEHSLNTLRYADRVKELGAESPEMKSAGEEEEIEEMQCEDDLALLHNSNTSELNDELYTFHNAISHLQELEEEVLDLHKTITEHHRPGWMNTHNNLLQITKDVDYDVDAYAQHLESAVEDEIQVLRAFKEKVSSFRSQLAEEELISKKIVKG